MKKMAQHGAEELMQASLKSMALLDSVGPFRQGIMPNVIN